jgi:hypothetical protein
MFDLLLESVLPKFDYYQAIYNSSTLQWQFQSQGDCDQVLLVQLYVLIYV